MYLILDHKISQENARFILKFGDKKRYGSIKIR